MGCNAKFTRFIVGNAQMFHTILSVYMHHTWHTCRLLTCRTAIEWSLLSRWLRKGSLESVCYTVACHCHPLMRHLVIHKLFELFGKSILLPYRETTFAVVQVVYTFREKTAPSTLSQLRKILCSVRLCCLSCIFIFFCLFFFYVYI